MLSVSEGIMRRVVEYIERSKMMQVLNSLGVLYPV